MEELLHQHYALTRVSDYVATPAMPPNDDDTSKLISRTLEFLQLYREPGRLFKSAEWQGSWNNWIKTAETRLLNFETQHDGARNGLGKLEKELLWNLVLGDYNPIRPLTMLLRMPPPHHDCGDSTPAVHMMVKFVYNKMIAASSKIAEHTSPLVFLGVRDWDHLNRWERINVALAAAQYYSRNRKFAEALHVVPLPPGLVPLPDTQFESLGRHVPSLTARQGRRNGISEKELRARWGA